MLAVATSRPAIGAEQPLLAIEEAAEESLTVAFTTSKFSLPATCWRRHSPLLVEEEDIARSFPDWTAFSTTAWAMPREGLFGPRRIELSRFDYALRGAGTGASTAMFLGAVAGSAGLWDEHASWYAIGAATGIGALLGGTVGTPDDPDRRFRLEWGP